MNHTFIRAVILLIFWLISSEGAIENTPLFSIPRHSIEAKPIQQGSAGLLVVGGEEAHPHQFPYLVNIQVRNYRESYDHHCGGTIYDALHIITASHCVAGIHPKNLKIVGGEHELLKKQGPEQFRDIRSYLYHPNYNFQTFENDIAIITLEAPLDLNDKIQPISVPFMKKDLPNIARTAGWGTDQITFNQTKLYYVDLNVYSKNKCKEKYLNRIKDGMLCAGYDEGGKGSCSGDSGGPLICKDSETGKDYLCGLVSWGVIPCALPHNPTVFVDINHYGDWLYQHLPELGNEHKS